MQTALLGYKGTLSTPSGEEEGYGEGCCGYRNPMVDEVSNRDVAQAFDELIEAHEQVRAAERSLEEYIAQNVPPEIPELFENVEALLRYNAERERYERGLSGAMEHRASSVAHYGRVASRVEPLLPEGARLVHAYGGSSAAIAGGKRYVVFKERQLTGLPEEGSIPLETATGETSAVAYVVRVEELVTGSE